MALRALSLSTEDWSEDPEDVSLEQSGNQHRAEQSCLARDAPDPRTASQPCSFYSPAVSLFICSTVVPFSQTSSITVDLFCSK